MWRYSEAEAKKNVRKEVEHMPDLESGIDHEIVEEIEDRLKMEKERNEANGPERARRDPTSGSGPDR